jgi:hypothetical protein
MVQRVKKDTIGLDRRQRLEALPGWSWDVLSDQWVEGFSNLKSFADREGHCRVSQYYKTNDGYRLGQWVMVQRVKKDTIGLDRRQRLEALPGWSWQPHSDRWEEGFSCLKRFVDRNGHCRVSHNYQTDNSYRLGQWVGVQRAAKEELGFERLQRLEALPGWSWDGRSDQWEEGFVLLKQFADREKHCRVPDRYKTENGERLGIWVAHQRTRKNLDAEYRQRLEALPGWSWDPRSDKWEEGFSYLKSFGDREGHCRVPVRYKVNGDYRLGVWVQIQRRNKETIHLDRRQRLEVLPGWSWDPYSEKWEEGSLKQFFDREGHCRVPQKYKTVGGYRLGQWVGVQRQTMDPDRRQRLEALPGWVWKVKK